MASTKGKPLIPVSVYFADEDDRSFTILNRHLAPLKQNNRIQLWNKQQISAGQELKQKLEDHLATDRLLIFLISSDFFASDLCMDQMNTALQRHLSGDATVLPILVRPCTWEETKVNLLQILPRSHKALSSFALPKNDENEELWQEVASEIIQIIDALQRWAFVVYAPEDEDVVERLRRNLASSNIHFWQLEHEQLSSDLSQNIEVRDAMRNAFVVVLITSPETASSHVVKAQMDLAADYHRPILLIWAKGDEWEKPDPLSWQAEMVLDARAEQYEMIQTTLMKRLNRQEKLVSPLPNTLPSLAEPRNPYKGLNAFGEQDADDFFGREALVRKMTTILEQILAEDTQGKRPSRLLTALLGASGSGKSSVVMAGLLPSLKSKGISNSREWIYLPRITPGKEPLEALAFAFSAHAFLLGDVFSILQKLTSDSQRSLHLLTRQLVGPSTRKVVLFIDQFEEIFTSTISEEKRQRFFDLLITAVTEPHGPLLVLLTLRADFYDRPMRYRELYDVLEAHHVAVLPMEHKDLRRVIEGPAQLPDVQLTFDEDLVGDLLFEVRDQGASLPLLQFTLDQLFERRNGHRLTRHAYEDIGGVKGALVQHAEETYANLPSEEHKKLAKTLFMRLIELGTTQQDTTRRRAVKDEFSLPDPRLKQLLQETIDIFIDARLLTTNEMAGTTTIEIGHEALIHAWPLYEQWIQEARENLPFQQKLSKDVEQWEHLGKLKEQLYHGSQLTITKKKVDQSFLNQQEIDFLRASTIYQHQQWIRMVSLVLLPLLLVGLVLTPLLVFRPTWCPSWLCPTVPLDKGGVHDSNLQVTSQTLQSSFKILPVAPSAYTLGTATPGDAQLIDKNQTLPYRVVLKIHSLQQGRYGLVIDQVGLVVNKQVQIVPYPLRVVIENNVSTYNNNLYRVTYRGQGPHALLSALYLTQPLGFVSLVPGETDEISLEVRSTIVVDLHFQVQVTYHVIGELASHNLTLPTIFAITFSDATNWHPYQIQAGHLIATS